MRWVLVALVVSDVVIKEKPKDVAIIVTQESHELMAGDDSQIGLGDSLDPWKDCVLLEVDLSHDFLP